MNKALELFQFEVSGVDPETGIQFRGVLKHVAIGTQADARKKAEQFEADLVQQEPAKKMRVTAVGKERVGPLMQQQMAAIAAAAEHDRLAAHVLAARLAEYVVRESLDIHPDMAAIAERLLDDARNAALRVLKASQPQRPRIVGADGEPLATA